ncbi:uncharacterized protein LOC144115662 [Amblyomma americanum]
MSSGGEAGSGEVSAGERDSATSAAGRLSSHRRRATAATTTAQEWGRPRGAEAGLAPLRSGLPTRESYTRADRERFRGPVLLRSMPSPRSRVVRPGSQLAARRHSAPSGRRSHEGDAKGQSFRVEQLAGFAPLKVRASRAPERKDVFSFLDHPDHVPSIFELKNDSRVGARSLRISCSPSDEC